MTQSTSKLQAVAEKAAWDENLRLWLEQHLKETGLTTTELARKSGGSRALYDWYLKCTYFGVPDPKNDNKIRTTENSKLEPMLRAYRARIEGPNSEKSSAFIKTVAYHQIRNAIQTAIEDNSISVAYGNYGWGKTRCRREYVKKLKTAPVEIFCSPNITTRYFVQKVGRALDSKFPISHAIPRLEDDIVAFLKSHPRALIVDQANYLRPKALGSICYIWEESGAPVVLIGTQTLYDNFFSLEMTDDERGQLASRVAGKYPITGLDLATVKGICERILGKDNATPQLVKTIWEKVGGKYIEDPRTHESGDAMTANFRSLEFRLRRLLKLMKINPGLPIDDEMMEKADRMLMFG
jgi:DNA transposition AAA+ family ATPase